MAKFRGTAIVAGIAVYAAFASMAFAQTAAAPAVEAGGGGILAALQPYIIYGEGALITAFIGWAATKFSAKTGVEIDEKNRVALHSAIVTGLNFGFSRLGEKIEGKEVKAGPSVISDAESWVKKSVPDAISRLNVSPETLRTMIQAKVPQVTGATAPVATPAKT